MAFKESSIAPIKGNTQQETTPDLSHQQRRRPPSTNNRSSQQQEESLQTVNIFCRETESFIPKFPFFLSLCVSVSRSLLFPWLQKCRLSPTLCLLSLFWAFEPLPCRPFFFPLVLFFILFIRVDLPVFSTWDNLEFQTELISSATDRKCYMLNRLRFGTTPHFF